MTRLAYPNNFLVSSILC